MQKLEYAGPQFHLWSSREGFSLSKQSFAHFRASRLKTLLDLSGVRVKSQYLYAKIAYQRTKVIIGAEILSTLPDP